MSNKTKKKKNEICQWKNLFFSSHEHGTWVNNNKPSFHSEWEKNTALELHFKTSSSE